MIYLSNEFTPRALFYSDDLADPFKRLLERATRQHDDPDKALRCVEEAYALGRATRAYVAQAAALIHLSDLHREAGRLDPALSCAQDAYDILLRQPGQLQRYNEAVAAYSLGLIHQLVGSNVEALRWHHAAARALESAREYWAACNRMARMHRCTDLEQLLHRLVQLIARGEHNSVLLLARLIGAYNGRFSVVELKVEGRHLSERLSIDSRAFRLLGPSTGLTLAAEGQYCAFQMPDPACARFGAQAGDYVLAQRVKQDNLDIPYVVVGAAGPDFVIHFQRDATGTVSFQSLATGQIIGGVSEDDLSIYRPVALLRPES